MLGTEQPQDTAETDAVIASTSLLVCQSAVLASTSLLV